MWRPVVLLVALATLGGGACRDGKEAQLDKVKATVCACKTAGCAELAMKDVPQTEIVSNHRTQVVARQMLDCLSRLYDEAHADAAGLDDLPAALAQPDPNAAAAASATGPGSSAPASAGTR